MPEWLSRKCNNLFTEKKKKSLISPSLEFWLALRKKGFYNSCIRTYRLLHCDLLLSHQNPSISWQKKLVSGWERCVCPAADCPPRGHPGSSVWRRQATPPLQPWTTGKQRPAGTSFRAAAAWVSSIPQVLFCLHFLSSKVQNTSRHKTSPLAN